MLALADRNPMTASNDDDISLRIERPKAGWTAVLSLVTALAMVLPLFGGLFLATSQALSEPDAMAMAREHPVETLQIAVGLLLMAGLLLVPIRRLVARIGRAGLVEIENGVVRVNESRLLSKRSFSEPLDAYLGVAHRIRTTLSGIQHDLILVHPDVRRDVVMVLDGSEPGGAGRMMARLGLPEIPVADIARARWIALPPVMVDGPGALVGAAALKA